MSKKAFDWIAGKDAILIACEIFRIINIAMF